MWKTFNRTTVSEFLGDFIVYRNLIPSDSRLPSLEAMSHDLHLPPGYVPRKIEPDYARVVVHLLQRARHLEQTKTTLQRLIFIGDTRMLDGTAFDHLCQVSGWSGVAFIASEDRAAPWVEIAVTPSGQTLYLANRWAMLSDFDHFLLSRGFAIDDATAVVVDLDKTAIGARGRNGHVVDRARLQAVYTTVERILGDSFDPQVFTTAYDHLNQPKYHPFTADNQDYLAYICLILSSGLVTLEKVVSQVDCGSLTSFRQFIEYIEGRLSELSPELAAVHREIYASVKQGDPTPFKTFRRIEYLETVRRMGHLKDELPPEDLLANEIVITQEVRSLALEWRERGALLFGLSDKPDEASKPTPELAQQGYVPIHCTPTHAVGNA